MPESLSELNNALNDLIEEIWEMEGFDRLNGRLEPEIKELTAIHVNQTMEILARRLFTFRIHAEKRSSGNEPIKRTYGSDNVVKVAQGLGVRKKVLQEIEARE